MSPLTLQGFAHKAQHAHDVGGTLQVTKDNKLVVKGSTWLGRRVQWLRQHLFPGKVRQQNQKVLDAFNDILKRTLHDRKGYRFAPEIMGSAKQFTAQMAQRSFSNYKEAVLNERQADAESRGGKNFEANLRLGVHPPPESPRLQASLQFLKNLDSSQKEALKARYVKFVSSVAMDKGFGKAGEIPGGSGRCYREPHGGPPTWALLDSGYMMIAEEAYAEGAKNPVPVGVHDANSHYGLANEAEVAWVREKLEAAS